MLPILIKLGPLTIHTYGVMIALGMFLGFQYILKYLRRYAVPEKRILDMLLYAVVSGLIAARLTYVLLNLKYYSHNIMDIFKIWEGGLVFYGGFAGGLLAVILFTRIHQELRLWTVADVFAPALSLSHCFGRIGCFSAGCCYGRETCAPWAVTYSNKNSLAPLNISLHPTQLYEAASMLIIFILLDLHNRKKHAEGLTFAWYLILYGIVRFCIEFLRGDDRGGFVAHLSPSQLFSLLLIIAGIVIFQLRRRSSRENNGNSPAI